MLFYEKCEILSTFDILYKHMIFLCLDFLLSVMDDLGVHPIDELSTLRQEIADPESSPAVQN